MAISDMEKAAENARALGLFVDYDEDGKLIVSPNPSTKERRKSTALGSVGGLLGGIVGGAVVGALTGGLGSFLFGGGAAAGTAAGGTASTAATSTAATAAASPAATGTVAATAVTSTGTAAAAAAEAAATRAAMIAAAKSSAQVGSVVGGVVGMVGGGIRGYKIAGTDLNPFLQGMWSGGHVAAVVVAAGGGAYEVHKVGAKVVVKAGAKYLVSFVKNGQTAEVPSTVQQSFKLAAQQVAGDPAARAAVEVLLKDSKKKVVTSLADLMTQVTTFVLVSFVSNSVPL